jgi:hypothetical protein
MARKLTDAKLHEIARLRRLGRTRAQIAHAVGLGSGTISRAFAQLKTRPCAQTNEGTTQTEPALGTRMARHWGPPNATVTELVDDFAEAAMVLAFVLRWHDWPFDSSALERVTLEVEVVESAIAYWKQLVPERQGAQPS